MPYTFSYRSLSVSLPHMESGGTKLAFLRHTVSYHQPRLNSNPLPFALSLLSYAMCFSGSSSLGFSFRCPCQCNSWKGAGISIHSTCPTHVHLLLLTCSLIVSMLALLRTSSFNTHIGQQISLLRHLCCKLSSFASSPFVILHDSLPSRHRGWTLGNWEKERQGEEREH